MCSTLADYALTTKNYEEALHWASALLTENHCDEEAHRHLMLAYAGQGRRNDVMRQYQRCQRILHNELGVELMPATVRVFEDILQGNEHRANREQK